MHCNTRCNIYAMILHLYDMRDICRKCNFIKKEGQLLYNEVTVGCKVNYVSHCWIRACYGKGSEEIGIS